MYLLYILGYKRSLDFDLQLNHLICLLINKPAYIQSLWGSTAFSWRTLPNLSLDEMSCWIFPMPLYLYHLLAFLMFNFYMKSFVCEGVLMKHLNRPSCHLNLAVEIWNNRILPMQLLYILLWCLSYHTNSFFEVCITNITMFWGGSTGIWSWILYIRSTP